MSDLINKFHQFCNFTLPDNLDDLPDAVLSLEAEIDQLEQAVIQSITNLEEQYALLEADKGMLGGFFDSRLKKEEREQVIDQLDRLICLDFDGLKARINDALYEIVEANIASSDPVFQSKIDYANLMHEAHGRTLDVIQEANEAVEALERAVDAETWDQWTNDSFNEVRSDWAMGDAEREVQDVNLVLVPYKEFLTQIGENAQGLYGSDYEFTWGDMMNDDFFGDFWGGEANIEKLEDGMADIDSLLERLATLEQKFASEFDSTSDAIHSIVSDAIDAMFDDDQAA